MTQYMLYHILCVLGQWSAILQINLPHCLVAVLNFVCFFWVFFYHGNEVSLPDLSTSTVFHKCFLKFSTSQCTLSCQCMRYTLLKLLQSNKGVFVLGSDGVGCLCISCRSVQVAPSLSQRLDHKLCLDSRLCGKFLLHFVL